jgi:hypothetical protein
VVGGHVRLAISPASTEIAIGVFSTDDVGCGVGNMADADPRQNEVHERCGG